MRLRVVEKGHRLPRKALLLLVAAMQRQRAPDVVRTLFYRPRFFGDRMCAWTNAVMRGPSEWTIGERELFAAFTSRLNRCEY
jgi:hypothetical protein